MWKEKRSSLWKNQPELVGTHYQIHFSQDEKNYDTSGCGKVYIDSETEQEISWMQSEIDRLVAEMLEMIYKNSC